MGILDVLTHIKLVPSLLLTSLCHLVCTLGLQVGQQTQSIEMSKKEQRFVNEPMGNKGVSQVPGVGKVLGQEFRDQGITKAYHLARIHAGPQVNMNHDNMKGVVKEFGANRGIQSKVAHGIADNW